MVTDKKVEVAEASGSLAVVVAIKDEDDDAHSEFDYKMYIDGDSWSSESDEAKPPPEKAPRSHRMAIDRPANGGLADTDSESSCDNDRDSDEDGKASGRQAPSLPRNDKSP